MWEKGFFICDSITEDGQTKYLEPPFTRKQTEVILDRSVKPKYNNDCYSIAGGAFHAKETNDNKRRHDRWRIPVDSGTGP